MKKTTTIFSALCGLYVMGFAFAETEQNQQISPTVSKPKLSGYIRIKQNNKDTFIEKAIAKMSIPLNVEGLVVNVYADGRVLLGRELFSSADNIDKDSGINVLGTNVEFTTSQLGVPVMIVAGKFYHNYIPTHSFGPLVIERRGSVTGAVVSVELPIGVAKEIGETFLSGAVLNSEYVRERENSFFETEAIEYQLSFSQRFRAGFETGFSYITQDDDTNFSEQEKTVLYLAGKINKTDYGFWLRWVNDKYEQDKIGDTRRALKIETRHLVHGS